MTAPRSGRGDQVDAAIVRACSGLEQISAIASVIGSYARMDPDTTMIGEAVDGIAAWASRMSDDLTKALRP